MSKKTINIEGKQWSIIDAFIEVNTNDELESKDLRVRVDNALKYNPGRIFTWDEITGHANRPKETRYITNAKKKTRSRCEWNDKWLHISGIVKNWKPVSAQN